MNGRLFRRASVALQFRCLSLSVREHTGNVEHDPKVFAHRLNQDSSRKQANAQVGIRGKSLFGFSALCLLLLTACNPQSPNRPPEFVSVIGRASPAIVAIGDNQGLHGSGFRIEGSRLIVTAAHVVNSLTGNPFVAWEGHHLTARLVRVNADSDLALLELSDDAPMPGLTLAKSAVPPMPGEWIIVLGCPFGARSTATVGIVSATPGAVLEPAELRTRMQLNAAVNPGNSGGPVLNLEGFVVGVANATIPGGFGLGFAIPASAVENLLAEENRGP